MVLEATPVGDPNYEVAQGNLANALVAYFERTGDSGALTESIGLLARRSGDKDREAARLLLLGWVLQRDAERSGDVATIKKAVAARRRALGLTGKSDPAYSDRLTDLGGALALQYTLTGNTADLDEAIDLHEASVARSPAGDPRIAARLTNLGSALGHKAALTGSRAILRRSVEAHREAVEAASTDEPGRAMFLSNLGIALLREYEASGSQAVLDEAIRRHREAVALTPEGQVDRVARLGNLAATLTAAYERTSEQDILDEVVRTYRIAVADAADQLVYRARYLYGLAGALFYQALRTGDLARFNEVVDLLTKVLELTPDGHPNKPNRLGALSAAIFARFREDPTDLDLLDDAITTLQEELRRIPSGHIERGRILSTLGALLDGRFEQTGDARALQEATRFHREALAATPAGHSERGRILSNLVISLIHQSQAADDDLVLTEAIRGCEEALEYMPPGDSGRAQTLQALGASYTQRYHLTGDSDAAAAGITAFGEAADDETGPARTRIQAGWDGGRLAASAGLTGSALRAFASAVQLLDEAAWAGLGRETQERVLGRLTGLSADAAAMAITEGRIERAVELLEQGRGVLLIRQLETPAQYVALRAHAPELAEQLAWIQRALDLPASGDPVGGDEQAGRLAEPVAADRRVELARQRDALIQEIRARPDVRDVVTPPSFSTLAAAAICGPVVIVNISRYRCDALIITSATVQLVPLPGLSADAVAGQVEALLEAADKAVQGVTPVLEWTWDQIVSPVFAHLGLAGPPEVGEQIPHIWWCPIGAAAFLPLHAAGRFTASGLGPDTALKMAVSSYIPTLRTLIQLRERGTGSIPPAAGPLVVAMPQTPDANDLPSAETEASDLARRFHHATSLSGSLATHAAVTEAMGRHPWAHFACHGVQDLLAPSRGRLLLYDEPLTIPQVMALRLGNPSFAFLSACETYRGGTAIPDEGITLATALQLAGYQHVIATLWQISGITATDVARHVYDQLVDHTGGATVINAEATAAALRTAILTLLAESPEIPPLYWAAYIHTGP
jgi:tetratricopeptide (TPR) repeat protein